MIEGENTIEVEHDQIMLLVVTVHNLHGLNDANYTFTAESVTGLRQAFRPTCLVVPPRENGSVNMIILQETVEPGTSHSYVHCHCQRWLHQLLCLKDCINSATGKSNNLSTQ